MKLVRDTDGGEILIDANISVFKRVLMERIG